MINNISFPSVKGVRGFTLIELLVVIAIIGILSSVVLASLNTARNKGADAAIKSNLSNARAEAEIYYDTNGNYTGACALTGTNVIGDSVREAERAYLSSANTTYANGTASTGTTAQCHSTTGSWAAWVPLKGSTTGSVSAYCVDSTGAAETTTAVLAANTYVCP